MVKVDIFSGFLGAGKTTLIKKLIAQAYPGEKLVLIENEFGEIGVDSKFLQEAGVEITEMNSGCICCSLVGDFGKALTKVVEDYAPERILIEPSGVGKLSDVIKAVENIGSNNLALNSFTTVVDAGKCKMYMKNFGEFFNDQVENAQTIILSHTGKVSEEKTTQAVELLREHNKSAVIVTTDWDSLSGEQLRLAIEKKTSTIDEELEQMNKACHCHGHEHHHGECHCHGHEHHHEECHCHDHEHHHHEDCHCHDHEHHHHHADDVFTSWGKETPVKYSLDEMQIILESLVDEEKFGIVLRAKGIVAGVGSEWIHFDYVPGEPDVRLGNADVIGKICVIGSKLNEDNLTQLFKI